MEDRIKYPFCGELIMATAKKCRFCGEWLTQKTPPNTISMPTNDFNANDNNETQPLPPIFTPIVQPTHPVQPTSATEHAPTVNTDGQTIINSLVEV